MAHQAIGKKFPAFEYEVGREKIREYANAVGETNPIHHDREAAQAAGFRDVVAPPMFAVVYSRRRGRARDLRPGGRPELRDDGPRRPGVRLGRAGLLRRRRSPRPTSSRTTRRRTTARSSSSSSPCRRTRTGRRSAARPGPTSSEEADVKQGDADPRAEGHARQVPAAPLRGRVRATSTRSTSTPSSPSRSACPATSCTASTRWPRWRARTARPRAARPSSSACPCSSAGWACPSRRSPSPAPSVEERDGRVVIDTVAEQGGNQIIRNARGGDRGLGGRWAFRARQGLELGHRGARHLRVIRGRRQIGQGPRGFLGISQQRRHLGEEERRAGGGRPLPHLFVELDARAEQRDRRGQRPARELDPGEQFVPPCPERG